MYTVKRSNALKLVSSIRRNISERMPDAADAGHRAVVLRYPCRTDGSQLAVPSGVFMFCGLAGAQCLHGPQSPNDPNNRHAVMNGVQLALAGPRSCYAQY
jgi:hypothetical protein